MNAPLSKLFVEMAQNGSKASAESETIKAAAPVQHPLSGMPISRILRPEAASRWMLPNLGAITPQYIEAVLRNGLAGSHAEEAELFHLMLDTWPELAACHAELIDGVMRKKVTWEPFALDGESATDSASDKASIVNAALRCMDAKPASDENDLQATMRDILDGWFRGLSVLEISWKQTVLGSHGLVVAPRCTHYAHLSCVQWTPSGELRLVNERGELLELPDNKFLIGIHKAKSGSPLGNSLLRPLAWWWCAANFSSDWLLNLAQLFGLPFRWASYDPNAGDETVARISTMLQNMGSAGWAAFPDGTKLDLKHVNTSGDHSPQGEMLDRADRYARLLILGQTMSGSQDSSKGGGKAFGSVEAEVKAQRIDAAGEYVCGVLGQMAKSIVTLNYGNDAEVPQAVLIDEQEAGLDEAQRDQVLSQIIPLSEAHLRRKYNLPAPEDEKDVARVATPQPPSGSGPALQAKEGSGKQETGDREFDKVLSDLSELESDEEFMKQIKNLTNDE